MSTLIPMLPLNNDYLCAMATARLFSAEEAGPIRRALEDGHTSEIETVALRLYEMLNGSNADYFRFDLDGVLSFDEPFIAELTAGDSTTRLGIGLNRGFSTRKLTAMLLLSCDQDQVVVRCDAFDREERLSVGEVLVVPSFQDLRVLCDGTAVFAVGHAYGDALR